MTNWKRYYTEPWEPWQCCLNAGQWLRWWANVDADWEPENAWKERWWAAPENWRAAFKAHGEAV